jgi:hypothetical protein
MIENALGESGGLISSPAGAAAKLGLPRQALESRSGNWESTGIVSSPRSFPNQFCEILFNSSPLFDSCLISPSVDNFSNPRERAPLCDRDPGGVMLNFQQRLKLRPDFKS